MKLHKMIVAAFAAVALTAAAYAAEATGNWKWSAPGRQGAMQDVTAKLEAKDGKLTGTVTNPRGELPVVGGTISKDGMIAFTTEQDFQGNKRVTKYTGKLDGDTIKGSFEAPGRGDPTPVKTDWAASRVK